MYKWLDAPFFDLLTTFSSLQRYFIGQAWFIGKIVLGINVGLTLLRYAIKGSGLSEHLPKLAIAFISFYLLITVYPRMIMGLNKVVYTWSVGSTYTTTVSQMIDKTRNAFDFWKNKANTDDPGFSDIIKLVEMKEGEGQGKKYILDIYDTKTGYIRPNAVVRLLILSAENIFNKMVVLSSQHSGVTPGLFRNFTQILLLFLAGLAVLGCGMFASIQYFICALEFTLITSVGVIMLPFMLWDGSKFLTEKLVGAIVGFSVKLLFVTIAFLLAINGFLGFMVRPFSGAFNEIVYAIFVSLFYMMICQSGPQLAVSLLTGSPQMSFAEGAAAAGTYAAAGVAGAMAGKAGARGVAKAAVRGEGALRQAAGAHDAVKELGGSKAKAGGEFLKSLGSSAGQGVKSMVHSMGRSLIAGGSGGGGGGRGGGTNRFSQTTALNERTPEGHSKTMKEYFKERYAAGQNRGLNSMVKKEAAADK